MKVIIKLDQWYTRGLVNEEDYNPKLENDAGQRCCLGFCALAHGADRVKGFSTPSSIRELLDRSDWMLTRNGLTSELAALAMTINDGGGSAAAKGDVINWALQPLEVRMGNLITTFAEGGDELEFVP